MMFKRGKNNNGNKKTKISGGGKINQVLLKQYKKE